jgi:hypothetical protein
MCQARQFLAADDVVGGMRSCARDVNITFTCVPFGFGSRLLTAVVQRHGARARKMCEVR